MRESFKFLGIIATLMSLVACQDLGAKLPKEDGEAKYGDIIDYRRSNSPISYTTKSKLVNNAKSKSIKDNTDIESDLTVEYYGGVNFDKLYYFVRAKKVETYNDGKTNEKEEYFLESWKYYKDGYLYEVLNNESKEFDGTAPRKSYTKLSMDKNLALELLLEEEDIGQLGFDDSMDDYLITKGNEIDHTYASYWNIDVSKGNNKSSLEYYSKGGEGNLSAVIKESGTFKTEAISKKETAPENTPDLSLFKYSSNFSFTFEKYHYGNFTIRYNVQLKDLDGIEIGVQKASINETVMKGCTVNYPKLDEYQEVTEIKGILPF